MQNFYNKLSPLAPTILRVGIALVFLWFGLSQLSNPSEWVGYMPQAVIDMAPFSATTLVLFNALFETAFGLALLVGFWTRTSALLLFLHMLSIISVVGYNEIGVRDFGIAIGALTIFLTRPDSRSIDATR